MTSDDFNLTPPPPKMPSTQEEKDAWIKAQAERPGLITYKTPPPSARAATQRILAQRRLANMHRQKPPQPGTFNKCGDCEFFRRYHGGGRAYGKCTKYGVSHSESTDWGTAWPACGMFAPAPKEPSKWPRR
jgi:hypothetical protein